MVETHLVKLVPNHVEDFLTVCRKPFEFCGKPYPDLPATSIHHPLSPCGLFQLARMNACRVDFRWRQQSLCVDPVSNILESHGARMRLTEFREKIEINLIRRFAHTF